MPRRAASARPRNGPGPPRPATRSTPSGRATASGRASGPWPGTTIEAPRPSTRSQAAIQLWTGPAHMIGVPVDEKDVAGEHFAVFRQMHQHVAARMGLGRPRSDAPACRRLLSSSSPPKRCAVGSRSTTPAKSKPLRKYRRHLFPGLAQPRGAAATKARPCPAGLKASISSRLAFEGDDLGLFTAARCRGCDRHWRGC